MKINHIQGLKGLAILQVVLMHMYLVLGVSMNSHGLPSPFHIVINGSFAVCLFLILSGYVISLSSRKIVKLEDLSCNIVKRYLRIALPITVIICIAYIMYLLGLFKIQDIASDTNNKLAAFYYKDITFRSFIENLLFSPLGCHEVLAPCWMLSYIFIGTILVYILHVCIRKLHFWIKILVLLLSMYVLYIYSSFLWSCVIFGMLTQIFDEKYPNSYKSHFLIPLIVVCLITGIYIQSIPADLINTDYKVNGISAILVWIGVNYCKPLRYLLSLRPFVLFGNISFSVYLVHWPAICSITCSLYYAMSSLEFTNMLLINVLTSLFSIFIITILYHIYVESKSAVIVDKIMKWYIRQH